MSTARIIGGDRPEPAPDLEALAERILADIAAGRPQSRPIDWPPLEAVSAAGERVAVNDHCSACRAAS